MSVPCTIFWFRRDLRLNDNRGLYEALKSGVPVLPVFIFDTNILDELPEQDGRVEFIHREVGQMKKDLREVGTDLLVFHGEPSNIFRELLRDDNLKVRNLYFNRDYEPYALKRDLAVKKLMEEEGIEVYDFKDHVIFETGEVLKGDGDPYVVFTPYKRTWFDTLEEDNEALSHFQSEDLTDDYLEHTGRGMVSLESLGFAKTSYSFPSRSVPQSVIRDYKEKRNFPALEEGTSRLGIHFRFGTISIREKARKSRDLSKSYLNELIWRDFYSQILGHFPRVVDTSFREKYDDIEWRSSDEEFEAWCEGKTGYPIVDAGMRQLNETGYMHNRVRMVAASFLTKHLLMDWRKGEAYFAEKLLDYDLASNNGGWQWAAGSGTDAAPYFRIFNPYTQREKFDKDKEYIKQWIPEYGTDEYPDPIVDHKEARERCLTEYKKAV